MKKITLFCMLLTLLGSTGTVSACIHPDSIITMRITYDDLLEEVEIRFTNLRLMNEAPNVFCTCGFQGSPGFDSIHYVAFVDSGTNDLYDNFAPWTPTADATAAWEALVGWDVSGFIGEVTAGGLTFGESVEMIIRLNWEHVLNPALLDSLTMGNVGQAYTDMLDVSMGYPQIANNHLGLWPIWGGPYGNVGEIIIVPDVQPGYFATQDAYILDQIANWVDPSDTTTTDTTGSTGLNTLNSLSLNISPNPASDFAEISLSRHAMRSFEQLELIALDGRRYKPSYSMVNERTIRIYREAIPKGLFIVTVQTSTENFLGKLMLN